MFRSTQGPGWSYIEQVVADGRMPWVSHKPPSGSPAADAAGTNDSHWASWGSYYADFWPNRVWFTYDHEHDRHSYSGSPVPSNPAWVQYQEDVRDAYRQIKTVMQAADPVHNLDHVDFVGVQTGWGFRTNSGRDPGRSWHPDIDVWAVDGYVRWMDTDGSYNLSNQSPWFSDSDDRGSGIRNYYQWCIDPVDWYEKYYPEWLPGGGGSYQVSDVVLNNLDKFPVRMGGGETGTPFEMRIQGGLWVPMEGIDPEDPDTYHPTWLRGMAASMRAMPRFEAVCYWHSATTPIGQGSETGSYYFAGPAAYRWGAEWASSIAAFATEAQRPDHYGTLTPWTPGGLA